MEDALKEVLANDDKKFIEMLAKAPDVTVVVAAAYIDGMKAGALMKESYKGEAEVSKEAS